MKFEYKTFTGWLLEHELTELYGKEGWELCGTIRVKPSYDVTYFFKRQIKEINNNNNKVIINAKPLYTDKPVISIQEIVKFAFPNINDAEIYNYTKLYYKSDLYPLLTEFTPSDKIIQWRADCNPVINITFSTPVQPTPIQSTPIQSTTTNSPKPNTNFHNRKPKRKPRIL